MDIELTFIGARGDHRHFFACWSCGLPDLFDWNLGDVSLRFCVFSAITHPFSVVILPSTSLSLSFELLILGWLETYQSRSKLKYRPGLVVRYSIGGAGLVLVPHRMLYLLLKRSKKSGIRKLAFSCLRVRTSFSLLKLFKRPVPEVSNLLFSVSFRCGEC